MFFINLTAVLKYLLFYHHISTVSAKFRLSCHTRSEVDITDVGDIDLSQQWISQAIDLS
jgi:hypothetical protein